MLSLTLFFPGAVFTCLANKVWNKNTTIQYNCTCLLAPNHVDSVMSPKCHMKSVANSGCSYLNLLKWWKNTFQSYTSYQTDEIFDQQQEKHNSGEILCTFSWPYS